MTLSPAEWKLVESITAKMKKLEIESELETAHAHLEADVQIVALLYNLQLPELAQAFDNVKKYYE